MTTFASEENFLSHLPKAERYETIPSLQAGIARYTPSSHVDRVLYTCQTLLINDFFDEPEYIEIVQGALAMLRAIKDEDPHIPLYHNVMALTFDLPDRI